MATVDRVADGLVVTRSPAGHRIEGAGGGRVGQRHIRAFYWLDRPYNLIEAHEVDGSLHEIFVHIASPARIEGREIRYTDHELDVVRRAGAGPLVVDEEEFAEAAAAYGYSPAFQAACRAAAAEAVRLAAAWAPEPWR
jgi:protein associated with RNAse G/E